MILGDAILWHEAVLWASFCLIVIIWAEIKGLG